MSIYSDVRECENLFDELCVNWETGEIDEVQEAELKKLREQIINEGLESLCKVRVNKQADIEALKQEEKRISEKRKLLEKGLDRFDEYIKLILSQSGKDKLEAGSFTVSTRKSIKTIVDDKDNLPIHYQIQHIEYKPDLKLIKSDLQQGKVVVGCHLEESYNLQVK